MRRVKSVPASYTVKADEGSGGWEVTGYASIFGNVDAYGDVVHKGAFAKTISERKDRVRFFWDHAQPLGKLLSVEEDAKGLKIVARISKTALGNDVKTLVEDGAVGDFSFGYDVVKGEENGHGGLDLRELKLYECSLVGIPANEEAVLTGVKSLRADNEDLRRELEGLKTSLDGPKDPETPDPDPEEKADSVAVGSFVSWNSSGGSEDADKPPIGKVVSIHTDGPVPGIDADVSGTEDDPAAKVEVYRFKDDDTTSWEATGEHVGHKLSALTRIDPPDQSDAEKSAGALPEEARAAIEGAINKLQALLEAPEPDDPSDAGEKSTRPAEEEPREDGFDEIRAELEAMKSL